MTKYILLAVSLLSVTEAICSVCSGLGDPNGPVNKACRYGEKTLKHTESRTESCYVECSSAFSRPIELASCFKGCLSQSCKEEVRMTWSEKIHSIFRTSRTSSMSQSVYIIDDDQHDVMYSLYINGQPVLTKTIHKDTLSHGTIVSYSLIRWSMFERQVDVLLSIVAILCLVLGIALLVAPHGEEGGEIVRRDVKLLSDKAYLDISDHDEMKQCLLSPE